MLLSGVCTAWADWNPTASFSFTYNGNTQPSEWSTSPSDYGGNCSAGTVSIVSGVENAKNCGTYNLTLHNNCENHSGDYTFTWSILPYDVRWSDFSVSYADQTWNGNQINVSPTVQFYSGTVSIVSGTDYTFYTTPSVVKDPGEYTLVVVGKGNFTGTTSLKFYVKKDINHADIKISERSKYQIVPNGSTSVTPVIELTDTKTGATLLQGTDFTISPTTVNANSQTTVTITGLSPRYTGTRTLDIWGLNEYYTKSTTPNNAVFDLHLIETTATGANAVLGNTANGVVISTDLTQLTIPASVDFDINTDNTSDATITITGIDNKAFTGCDYLSWIDATKLTNYTPSGLDRTAGAASPFAGVPKQSLVFLYGSTITGENYVYKLGAGNDYRCDVFKIYDDTNGNQKGFDGTDYSWAYENPYDFRANTVVNTRVLSAGQHYTTCLPYPLQLPSSIKAYTLEASSSTLLGFKEVTGPLTAFTPYVIIPSSSGALLSTENVTIPATTGITNFDQVGATTATTVGSHKLVGSLRYMTNGATGCYIMQSGNIWKLFTGTGSHPNACILPMRAYVISSGYPSPARPRLSAVFNNGDGSTTAIDDLRLNPDDSDGSDNSELFDLQGRRVTSPPSPGIYIRNGKKIIVK